MFKAQRFELGQVVATPGCLSALEATGQTPLEFVGRHVTGDWGELPLEDVAENELSLKEGYRLLSVYSLSDGTKIWVIMERDTSTTLLLPEDY